MIVAFFALALSKKQFGIMIDAGSKGTRVHVFQWDLSKDFPDVKHYPDNENPWSIKFKIPLASAANNESVIRELGSQILGYLVDKIESKKRKETKMYLYATAGMRVIPEIQQKQVLDDIFEYLSNNSDFIMDRNDFTVIPGSYEGIYGWISVNHLKDKLSKKEKTYGMLDQGGASMQIANLVDYTSGHSNVYSFQIGKNTYNVFSYSYLGFGSEQSKAIMMNWSYPNQANLKQNPCLTYNFSAGDQLGIGNFHFCSDYIMSNIINTASFQSVHITLSSKSYYGISGFYDLKDDLGLNKESSLKDLLRAGEHVCSAEWNDLQKEFPKCKRLDALCFNSAFQYSLLTQGWGFNDDNYEIIKAEKIDSVEVSWALGAMLLRASGNTLSTNTTSQDIPTKASPSLYPVLIVFFVAVIIMGIVFFRKPKHIEMGEPLL